VTQCQRCGLEIAGRRKDAKFCSNSCRVLAWQEQHRTATVPAPDLAAVRRATRRAITALQHFEAVLAATLLPGSARLPRSPRRPRQPGTARPEARL